MPEYTLRSDYASVIAVDQHARSVTLSATCLPTGEHRTGRLARCPGAAEIAEWASWSDGPRLFVYESGPCGFQLARDLRALGQGCDVIATSTIPRSPQARAYKDDRGDAESLLEAVTSANSRCRAVWVPSAEAEGARDLVRAYVDLSNALKSLKMQTSAILLRHGFVWDERTASGSLKKTWTRGWLEWATSARTGDAASDAALALYVSDALAATERLRSARRALLELSEQPRWKPCVDALSRLKCVERLTALAFAASVDDFSRFKSPRSVSKYFGLVPGRDDSGERCGRGGRRITRAGDSTVRRLLIEALTSLPGMTPAPKALPAGCTASLAVEAEAQRCNQRNVERYRALVEAGKRPNVAKVAVASELARQMWVIGSMAQREAAQAG